MAVCIVRLVSTADSKTEKLLILLTVSNSRHCIVHAYMYMYIHSLVHKPCAFVACSAKFAQNASAHSSHDTCHSVCYKHEFRTINDECVKAWERDYIYLIQLSSVSVSALEL